MLSRRNIRVKVMQTLYAVDSMNGGVKLGEPIFILTKKIEQSKQLFTYLIYFITETARYAETDANIAMRLSAKTDSAMQIKNRRSLPVISENSASSANTKPKFPSNVEFECAKSKTIPDLNSPNIEKCTIMPMK